MNYQDHQTIELPDRKLITLCEAVTAVVYGKAHDPLQPPCVVDLDRSLTGAQLAKATDLLERLQKAAYAGRVKFRGIQECEDSADGYKDIDPLYFYIKPLFNWRQNVILHLENESSTPWYFVHLDREQFSLLLEKGGPVKQNPDDDVLVRQTTFRTGTQGQPTSKHLIQPIARRRLDAGDFPETLAEFSRQLAEQLKDEHPEAAPMTPKTIQNNIRGFWKSFRPK